MAAVDTNTLMLRTLLAQQQQQAGATQSADASGAVPQTQIPGSESVPQAQQGANQVAQQPTTQVPESEPFNAPVLKLPNNPTSRNVLDALARAMAHPEVNETTAKRLYELHQQILEQDKAMIQTVMDGMLR